MRHTRPSVSGSERAEEGDRISPLKGNWQVLEHKYCLSAVLGDKCDPPANLLNQFNSHLVPYLSSFSGNWGKEVSAGKITIIIIITIITIITYCRQGP